MTFESDSGDRALSFCACHLGVVMLLVASRENHGDMSGERRGQSVQQS